MITPGSQNIGLWRWLRETSLDRVGALPPVGVLEAGAEALAHEGPGEGELAAVFALVGRLPGLALLRVQDVLDGVLPSHHERPRLVVLDGVVVTRDLDRSARERVQAGDLVLVAEVSDPVSISSVVS